MPVVAYQSFNSNASHTHGFSAMSGQRFTTQTNNFAVRQGDEALVLPSDTGEIGMAIEGPAQLLPVQRTTSPQTVNVFGTQIALLWQNVYRMFQKMPDIMVCGEMDASHPDFQSFVKGQDIAIHAKKSDKACQCFTAISQSSVAAQITPLGSGEGFVAYLVGGVSVVFVHVPNAIATKSSQVEAFYRAIAKDAKAASQRIDVVMGDTNQSRPNFTEEVLNDAFGISAYTTASGSGKVEMVDNWNAGERGTNSNGQKMYDVAVYRDDTVTLKGCVYISQSSGAVTVTDHCGLGVWVERKSS